MKEETINEIRAASSFEEPLNAKYSDLGSESRNRFVK
jgi:hypothetical protein